MTSHLIYSPLKFVRPSSYLFGGLPLCFQWFLFITSGQHSAKPTKPCHKIVKKSKTEHAPPQADAQRYDLTQQPCGTRTLHAQRGSPPRLMGCTPSLPMTCQAFWGSYCTLLPCNTPLLPTVGCPLPPPSWAGSLRLSPYLLSGSLVD